MAKIWDEDSVSEYDLIAEDAQKAEELAEEYAAAPTVVDADEEELEEISDESAFELTNTESNVIYNARLRLEQAKLYELLINHNLFEGVDASPQAIKNVQNELKFYIVKRLEILLGLREPVVRVATAVAESPFNDVEVDFLKQLAYKGTFGKSTSEAQEQPQRQAIRPATPAPAKLKSLAPSQPKKIEPPKQEVKAKQPAPKAPVKQAAPAAPAKKAAPGKQPAKKAAPQPDLKTGIAPRPMTPAEAEAIARADLKTASKKPFHEMSDDEKLAKIREVNERNARPKATGQVPMPSANELEMKYMTQQQNRGYSKNQTDQFNLVLANALAAQKNRGDEYE